MWNELTVKFTVYQITIWSDRMELHWEHGHLWCTLKLRSNCRRSVNSN